MTGRRDMTRIAVALAALAVLALVAFKLVAQMAAGPYWDSFSFLANAADFAGRGYGYAEPARPPLISVVTAVPLALGLFDERVIQVVDALLALASLGGFYLLLRRRFSAPLSAGGTLALLMAPPVWQWIGVGYTDLAGVGLCAWALYFAVRATEDDPRFYLAAFPTLTAAALMRVTSLLFVLPFGLWLLMRARPFRQRWLLAGGILAALASYAPFAAHYMRVVGEPLYPFVAGMKVQEAGSAANAVRQVGSFVTSLHALAVPAPIAVFALGVLALGLFGSAKAAWRFLHARGTRARSIVLAVLVAAASLWAARTGGLVLSQGAIALAIYAVWRLLAVDVHEATPGLVRRVPADLALDAVMLGWLLGYLVFHESWAQRVPRYYMTMAPGVVYLVVLGWRMLAREVAESFEQTSAAVTASRRPLALGAAWLPLVLLVLAGLALDVVGTTWTADPEMAAFRTAAQWLSARPDVATATVYSEQWPATSWYLKRPVEAMPLFDNEPAVAHELRVNRATYYMTRRTQVDGYATAFESGVGRVLVSAETKPELPRMLYLGAGWENYLESLDGYGLHLMHEEGDYNLQGTAFLDAYDPARLRGFGTIAAFGFLWHDRSGAERALEQWVADGGTLVIDASANLEPPASLDASVLFDTVIRRAAIPRDADVTVAPDFAAAHPGLAPVLDVAPFVTEDGRAWFGASYSPLPGSEPLNVLASAGGRPLVAERRWGEGRVLWLGYNLAWHAYQGGDEDEARLVSAVLDEALAGDGRRLAGSASPLTGAVTR